MALFERPLLSRVLIWDGGLVKRGPIKPLFARVLFSREALFGGALFERGLFK